MDNRANSPNDETALITAEIERLKFVNSKKWKRIKYLESRFLMHAKLGKNNSPQKDDDRRRVKSAPPAFFQFKSPKFKIDNMQISMSSHARVAHKDALISPERLKKPKNNEIEINSVAETIEALKEKLRERTEIASNLKELVTMNNKSIERLTQTEEEHSKTLALKERLSSLKHMKEVAQEDRNMILKEIEETEEKWNKEKAEIKESLLKLGKEYNKKEVDVIKAKLLNILIKRYSLAILDSIHKKMDCFQGEDEEDLGAIIEEEISHINYVCGELDNGIQVRQEERKKSLLLLDQLQPFLDLGETSRKSVDQLSSIRLQLAANCFHLLTSLKHSTTSHNTVRAGLLSLKAKLVHLHGTLESDKQILSGQI